MLTHRWPTTRALFLWLLCETVFSQFACFPPALDKHAEVEADSDTSDEETEIVHPVVEAPRGVTGSIDLDDRVRILWAPVSGANAYHVYRDGERLTAGAGVATTSYDDLQALAIDGVWTAPGPVEASTTLTNRVRISWSAPVRPIAPNANYHVTATVNGLESSPSMTVVGRRAARPIERFEVEVAMPDEPARWISTDSTDTEWDHQDPPMGTIKAGQLSASRGDFASRVHLELPDVEITPGALMTYRVRGALQAGGVTPTSVPTVGRRAVGEPTFEWHRTVIALGGFESFATSQQASADDTADPQDGGTREYRVYVQADGSQPLLTDPVPGWRLEFAAIAVGSNFACGLTPSVPDGGRVWCWGANTNGQLGLGSNGGVHPPRRIESLQGASKLAAVSNNACVLTEQGLVWCWGQLARLFEGTDTRPQLIPGLEGVNDLALTGSVVACASTESKVYCWGRDLNSRGLLGDGTSGTTRFLPAPVKTSAASDVPRLALASGIGFHMCGASSESLFCWGSNGSLQLGSASIGATSPFAVEARPIFDDSDAYSVMGFATCGVVNVYVVCWGRPFGGGADNATGAVIGSVSNNAAIDSGGDHLCVLDVSGLSCLGDNGQGQLGDGTISASATLVRVPLAAPPSAFSAGSSATCALVDGRPWCWGYNGERHLQVEASDTLVLAPSLVPLPE